MRTRSTLLLALAMASTACGDDTVINDGGNDSSIPDNNVPDITVNDTGANDGGGDAPSDVTTSDVTTNDGGAKTSIACGAASCPLPGQSCCLNPNGNKLACSGDAGACPAGDVSFQCASAADCSSGQVCCINATVDPAVATCSATCTGTDHAMLCDPNGTPTANACGDAGACGNGNIDTWNLSNKFGTCGDQTGPN